MKVWSILIATVFERSDKLVRLLNRLVPQVVEYGDKVQLLISSDDRKRMVADKRQELLEKAKGQYVSFVDDDDLVAEDYVEKLLPYLNGVNDYVGFKLQLYEKGKPQKPTYHNMEYGGVLEDENGYYRDISHLNPTRTDIARQGKFYSTREDETWSKSIRESGKIRRWDYLDEFMYFYYFDPSESFWTQEERNSGR